MSLRLSTGGAVEGSHLLVATGRRPNTDDLGCEVAGVELDARGFVPVDDHYRTTAPGVYAVGDCTGGPQFTHTAWDDHRLLFDVLMGRPCRGRKDRLVPYTAYTDPQVAGVGMTEREAACRASARSPTDRVPRNFRASRNARMDDRRIDERGRRVNRRPRRGRGARGRGLLTGSRPSRERTPRRWSARTIARNRARTL